MAVIRSGNNNQRLLAGHIGLDGFPHAGHFTLRLDPRQRPLQHLALLVVDHFVEQFRVRQRCPLGGQVIAAVGGVGVKVLLRQAHFVQVLPRCAIEHDGIGGREVVGGDVVRQNRQRAHALQPTLFRHVAFPVGRAANVGALGPPFVERAYLRTRTFIQIEHRDIGLAELLGLHRRLHDGIDFAIVGPDVLEGDRITLRVIPQHVFFDIKANGACDGIRHHQRR